MYDMIITLFVCDIHVIQKHIIYKYTFYDTVYISSYIIINSQGNTIKNCALCYIIHIFIYIYIYKLYDLYSLLCNIYEYTKEHN